MRRRAAWLGAIAVIGTLVCPAFAATTQIGEAAPRFGFKDIRYLRRTLSDLGDHKGFALVFLNTDCPVAKRFLPKLRELNAGYAEQGIQFVAVFCSAEDTVMEMASFALENELRFPVVKDEDHSVCTALGIDRVPQVAVLDAQRRLVYRGRINDQYRVSGTQPNASREDLATALDELLAGKLISIKETPVDGCKVTPPHDAKFAQTPTFHGDSGGNHAAAMPALPPCGNTGAVRPDDVRRSEGSCRDGGRSGTRSADASLVCGCEVWSFHQRARHDR